LARALTERSLAGARALPSARRQQVCARGAVVVQANLFSRVARIFKSYTNQLGARLPASGQGLRSRSVAHTLSAPPAPPQPAHLLVACTRVEGSALRVPPSAQQLERAVTASRVQ